MLTVKHIHIGGTEDLYQAYSVHHLPAAGDKPQRLHIGDESDGLTGGTAFVMNDHGKTVSRYDLGASPVPIGVDDAKRTAA